MRGRMRRSENDREVDDGSQGSPVLVGRKVAVRLNSVEARGVELVATLDEAREDGIVLSEIGELGQGLTLFCPWESLHRVRDRPSWLAPPHEVSEGGQQGWESYELREASEEDVAPEPLPERREPSARTLERVVPVAQRVTVDGVTFAIASLELYGEASGCSGGRSPSWRKRCAGLPTSGSVYPSRSSR